MATRITLTALEQRILNRIYLSSAGFERVEELHEALGAEDHDFVDALESLEGDGYLWVSNLGGAIVVAQDNPLALLGHVRREAVSYSNRVGQC